jgi:drug/metabolite transporter (DMT)-like permease
MRVSKTVYIKLVLTMLFWGGTWIAGRIVAQEIDPLQAAIWRFLFASIGLIALVLVYEGRLPLPSGRQFAYIVLLGASGIFFYNLFFFYGLQRISAGRGALVVALNPAMAAVLAWTLRQERITALKGLGVAVAFAGSLIVISNGDPAALVRGDIGVGDWLIFGCVVCWTAYTFIGRVATKTLTPLVATAYGCLAGLVMLLLALVWRETPTAAMLAPHFSALAWGCLLFLGIFATTIGYAWYNDGVRRIGAARAAAFINLVPVAGVLLGALLLGERLGLPVLGGGAMILLGVWLTNRARTT